MIKIKIFYSKKQNKYYFSDIIDCSFCKKEIDYNCRFYTFQTRKELIQKIVCIGCHKQKKILDNLKELKEMSIVFEPFTVFLTDIIPLDSKIILLKSIKLKSSQLETAFSIADKNDSVVIDDKTILSGRESLEGAFIGKSIIESIDNKDGPINDIDFFLEDLRDSEPVLLHSDKKLLENKSKKRKK